MIEALVISNVVLWVIVAVLAAVVVALARQVGVLHERVSPAGALLVGSGPRVGEAAPRLEVEDWSGRRLSVGGANDDGWSTLLLFISPTCPVCKTLLSFLDSTVRAEDRRVRVLLASDGPRAEHEEFVRAHQLERRSYVLSSALGLAFRVPKLPYAVLIDAAGTIRAKGLINTREHLESLFEAKEQGVASIQEYVRGGDSRRVA